MGKDVLESSETRAIAQQADDILGWSVAEICQSAEDKLSRTLYTQPCLYVVECLLADQMRAKGHHPALVAGHSLGEYVALYVAQVFSFSAGLQLVKRRAELMDSASDGTMAALIGFDRDQLTQQIQQTPDVVLANDNNAGQVVISGTIAAVETVLNSVKAKRAVKLNVSGAFHSPLMAAAATEFQGILDQVSFNDAKVPILSNVDPTPATDAALLKQRLIQQMTGAVRWREISLQLPELGIETVVEIGPGKVLTGLIKRSCPNLILKNVSNLSEIPAVVDS